jgi:hypothetical protein
VAGVAIVEIPDPQANLTHEIDGERIAFVSTRRGPQDRFPPRPKWGENAIYRLASGKYLLHRAGYSVIYHTSPTSCRTTTGSPSGDKATVADLPDDAVPCEQCAPPYPDELADDEEIRYEYPRHSFDECETPAQVSARLTSMRRHSGVRSRTLSEPARELLEQAMENDPEFGDAPRSVSRYG